MLSDQHHERDTQDDHRGRTISRLTVETARFIRLAVSRIDEPEAIPREISSRSARVRARRDRRRAAGRIPPRGNNTDRMQLCSLPKARPISCGDCPAFQRSQTSPFSIAESPNRFPGLMPTPPFAKKQIYIRWCCIDLSNAPRYSDKWSSGTVNSSPSLFVAGPAANVDVSLDHKPNKGNPD